MPHERSNHVTEIRTLHTAGLVLGAVVLVLVAASPSCTCAPVGEGEGEGEGAGAEGEGAAGEGEGAAGEGEGAAGEGEGAAGEGEGAAGEGEGATGEGEGEGASGEGEGATGEGEGATGEGEGATGEGEGASGEGEGASAEGEGASGEGEGEGEGATSAPELPTFVVHVGDRSLIVDVTSVGAQACAFSEGGVVNDNSVDFVSGPDQFRVSIAGGFVPGKHALHITCSNSFGATTTASGVTMFGGDVSDADFTPLIGTTVVLGDFNIGPGNGSLTLDGLSHVAGSVAKRCAGSAAANGLQFPTLREVFGALLLDGCSNGSFDFEAGGQTLVVGSLVVTNDGLPTLSMPTLTEVRGDVTVSDDANLASLNLSGLTLVDGQYAFRNDTALDCVTAIQPPLCSLVADPTLVDVTDDLAGCQLPSRRTCP